ncbi:hypothetical protein LOTGIDRAFT_226051 [Lottia gigantea]|uniref:Large ribosomal subunit protein eL28 n=1 Tax=Lottia gigantea TaxID=225164 RepID=V4ASC8_LOTGI|nr:hypothetical protein LOTGIDRAFT_226051 [Lottia gigantea]ESP00178.1 hypothetical protein LOTGIDRAFT_226051 [Lottia gigantea]
MSASFNWMIVRNNSSFLMKRGPHQFSREAGNLKGKNTFRFNGLIRDRTIAIQPAKTGKGITVTTRHLKRNGQKRPNKRTFNTNINKDGRHTLKGVSNIMKSGKFDGKTHMAALRKTSAILRSQKPVVVKQRTRAKKN